MNDPSNSGTRSTASPSGPERVLIVEDVPRDADLILRELRRSGLTPQVRVVNGRREFIEALETFAPDLILADYNLPQFNALEALQILNQKPADAAFIIVSGTIGEEKAVECMKLGAADYLLKDRLARLVPAILQAVEKKHLLREKNQSEQALRRSEKRYRELFLKMSNGVTVFSVLDEGRDFVFSDLNPAAERIDRIQKHAVLGISMRKVFPRIESTGLPEIFRQVWLTGRSTELPLSFYQDDRISGWRRTSIYKLNAHEIVSVCEDLTEQVEAREEAQRQRDFLQQVIDAIPNPVFYNGIDGRYLGCNTAFAAYLGRSREEIAGRSVYELAPVELAVRYDEMDRALLAEPGVQTYESKVIYADGRKRDVILNKATYSTPDGRIAGLVGVMQDITALKEVQEELINSENKYRNIVEHIGIGVALISPQMKIMELNPQMRKWFPKARPQDRSICYEAFCDPPGSTICGRCPTHATLQDGRVHELIRETRLAGVKRNFRLVASPIRNADGQVVAAIEIVEDITQRLMLEKQLRQAQKMEAIGTLAGGIAHDFNNILSAILGFSELSLDDSDPGSSIHNNLQEVLHAGHRAKDLVQQILAFSRQVETDLKPVQASAIIKEALKLLGSTLPATIEIDARIDSPSLIMGDPTQVHQIIMNLCTNAAYAMRESGGVLTVSLTDLTMDDPVADGVHMVPGPCLHLTVADTGAGIAPEHLESIFEPYFSTKPEGEGTGLGLSVVHGIVKKYGGDITVGSDVGQGTVFDIYLPVIERRTQSHRNEKQRLITGGSEKVLFVDDEPQITKLAKQHLEKLGYRVEVRTDSREALELFKKRFADFDLVITDMNMPHMSGDKLAQEMLKISAQIPIILCTGFSQGITEKRAAQLGIKALAMKPLVRDELALLVRKIIDGIHVGNPFSSPVGQRDQKDGHGSG